MSRAELHAKRLTAALLPYFIKEPGLLDDLAEIGLTSSPSSAFRKAYLRGVACQLGETGALGCAKLARWIAVVKRDQGEKKARELVAELKNYISHVSQGLQSTKAAGSPEEALDVFLDGLVEGVFKYGSYGWLADYRLQKIEEAYRAEAGRELDKRLHQLAIEVFHSLYLFDTTVAEERVNTIHQLKNILKVCEPILDSRIRKHTVLNENLSIAIAAKILSSLDFEENAVQLSKLDLKELEESAKQLKKSLAVIEAFVSAGVGSEMSFDTKLELAELLSKYPVFVNSILEAVEAVVNEGKTGGSIVFSGYRRMSSLSEVARLAALELAMPESLLDAKLLSKTARVKKYKYSPRRSKKKLIVLIDKSGSMKNGDALTKAKAVAVALLLHPLIEDVKVAFFDYSPFPDEPISLRENFEEALRKILAVSPGGGTSIDTALKYADEKAPGYDILLITDGRDLVTYKPENRLIAVEVENINESLEELADVAFRVSYSSSALTVIRAEEKRGKTLVNVI